MKNFFQNIVGWFVENFYRLKVWFAYHFKLKPKIAKMRQYVNKIINIRSDAFPLGKSLFVFPGEGDIIYFIVYKENDSIIVQDVFDEILNKIPETYRILRRINFLDLLPNHH